MQKSFEQPNLRKLSWAAVRDEVAAINPELAAIIDDLDPDDSYPLYRANYVYGDEILKQGILQLPDSKGQLIPITHPDISDEIKSELGYNLFTNPVSMVLKNSIEIFFMLESHTIPLYGLVPLGKLISTWRILSQESHAPAFLWGMTAGARSLVMLPKISDKKCHKRLQKSLGISCDVPKHLIDQWQVFKAIANHGQAKTKWQTEMLFFTKPWFDNLKDKRWQAFHCYLLNAGWQSSEHWRNQFAWDIVFSTIKRTHHLKPDPYIDDTVRNLLGIGLGFVPALQPTTDNRAAPVDYIKRAYMEYYRLRDYAPIMMQPAVFNHKCPIYYSLKYPTTISFSPRANRLSTAIDDLESIQNLLKRYVSSLVSDNLNIAHTPIYQAAHELEFSFFHPKHDNSAIIHDTQRLAQEDERFYHNENRKHQRAFPYRCELLNGIIRIE